MNTINYDDYIKSKKLFKIQDKVTDNVYFHGLQQLIEKTENGYDYVSYTTYLKFTLFNAAVLERDNDDNYIYKYEYKRTEDVIDNLKFKQWTFSMIIITSPNQIQMIILIQKRAQLMLNILEN